MGNKKLTDKEERFKNEYIVILNGTKAAITAGYSEKTARSIASENLSKPHIQEAIQEAIDKRSKRTEVTADRVIKELAKLAFTNLTDVIDTTGGVPKIKDLSGVKEEALAAISTFSEDDKGKRSIKMHDKTRALEMLGRHLKLFTDKTEHSGPDGNPINTNLTVEFITARKEDDEKS